MTMFFFPQAKIRDIEGEVGQRTRDLTRKVSDEVLSLTPSLQRGLGEWID